MTPNAPIQPLPSTLLQAASHSAAGQTSPSAGGKPPGWLMHRLPGLLLASLLAALAVQLAAQPMLRSNGISVLTVAILAGLLAGHVLRPDLLGASKPGIDFAKQTLLRLGVALYGLRLTLAEVQGAGWAGLATDLAVIAMVIGLAATVGPRLLGMGRRQSLLIGSGAAICGAAAVLATAPVLRARAGEVAVAVATVVTFGTLAIFLYPLLFSILGPLGWLPGGESAFGFYIGSTVHEVAQVIAAAEAIGPAALDTAVVAKMVRVMLLAPFLVLLACWLAARPDPEDDATDGSGQPVAPTPISPGMVVRAVPWFAVAFLLMVALNSTGWVPAAGIETARTGADLLLAMAMAALGMTIRMSALRAAGSRPLILAAVLFGALIFGGALINRVAFALF